MNQFPMMSPATAMPMQSYMSQPPIAPSYQDNNSWPFTTPFMSPQPSYPPAPQVPQYQMVQPMPQPMPIVYQPPVMPYNPYAMASAQVSPYGAMASAGAGFGALGGFGGLGGYDPLASLLSPGLSSGLGSSLLGGLGGSSSLLGGGLLGGSSLLGGGLSAGSFAGSGLLGSLLGGSSAGAFAGSGSGLLSSLLGLGGLGGSALATASAGNGSATATALVNALLGNAAATATTNTSPSVDNSALLALLLKKLLGNNTVVAQPTTTIAQPTTTTTVANPTDLITVNGAGHQNITWGDPHFEYFTADGKKKYYDFQGKPNTWFNLIEDGNMKMNAHFKAYGGGGATVMDKLGLDINGKKLTYDANGTPTLDGKALEDGKQYKFDSGIKDPQGRPVAATISWDKKSNTLDVITGEYHFVAKKESDYIRLLSTPTDAGVFANGRAADGVLGRSFNPNFANFGKDGKRGANAQGEGFLDKKMDAYIVDGAFGDAAAVKDDATDAKWGVLAQNKNKAGTTK